MNRFGLAAAPVGSTHVSRRLHLELLEDRVVLTNVTLSIPTNLNAFQGGVVAVPVNINQLTDGAGLSGISSANFAIDYDPSVFTVSPTDIHLGTVPASGVSWTDTVNQLTGQLGINITNTWKPITTTFGDSLVTIDFHVQALAPLGNTPINLAATNSVGGLTTTAVFDQNSNQYTLTPAPTNGSNDSGVDGSVNILSSASAPALGSWVAAPDLTLAPSAGNPSGIGTMLLLTNGTVMATGGSNNNSQDWFQLTPNPTTGSYATGSWTKLTSMSTMRRFFGSVVLNNGMVMVVGGEYTGSNNSTASDNATGEIYDPTTGMWKTISVFPTGSFGDGQLELMNDGTVLAGYLNGGQTYRYNPTTDSWTTDAVMLNGDRPNEESWIKLPDGSILTYEIFGSQPQTGQRFVTQAIASAVGTASTPITITTPNPLTSAFTTGASVTIVGVAGFAAANGTFNITVTGTNTFTLDGTTGTIGSGTANTGSADQWVAAGTVPVKLATSPVSASDTIVSAVGSASTPITITSTTHLPAALTTGASVMISGVAGFAAANGTFNITVTGAEHVHVERHHR